MGWRNCTVENRYKKGGAVDGGMEDTAWKMQSLHSQTVRRWVSCYTTKTSPQQTNAP